MRPAVARRCWKRSGRRCRKRLTAEIAEDAERRQRGPRCDAISAWSEGYSTGHARGEIRAWPRKDAVPMHRDGAKPGNEIGRPRDERPTCETRRVRLLTTGSSTTRGELARPPYHHAYEVWLPLTNSVPCFRAEIRNFVSLGMFCVLGGQTSACSSSAGSNSDGASFRS